MNIILATFVGSFIGHFAIDILKKNRQKKRENIIAACACEVQGIINHLKRTNQPVDPYIEKSYDRLLKLLDHTPLND